MTAKIIDFEKRRREREQDKKAQELLSVDFSALDEKQLQEYIVRLAKFAKEIEDIDYSNIHFPEDDQT